MFSYLMGVYIDILTNYSEFNNDYDDDERLDAFFGLMKKFNGNKNLNKSFLSKMEIYFHYRWYNDHFSAFILPKDYNLYE